METTEHIAYAPTRGVAALRENSDFHGLYKAGAAASLMAAAVFRRNLDAEWMLLRGTGLVQVGPSAAPDTIEGWLLLIQQHPLLGLTFLNLFDLVNYALVGLIILALVSVLWQTSRSCMMLAGALGFMGVAVYFASNQAFSLLSLSHQYAAAATDAQRAVIQAAGQAVLTIHQNDSYAGAGIYPSFLLVSTAGLIIAATMLWSDLFSRVTALMGILANGFQLSYYPVLIFAPALVVIPICISAVFLLVWYIQVGIRLWSLGSDR